MQVLICDDHTLVRAGLRRLLEGFADIEVVAEAASADEAVVQANRHRPDAILLDLSMPGRGGLEALDELRRTVPGSAVVMMSMHDDPQHVRAALERGASGFVVKDAAPAELEIALRAATSGRTFLSPQVSGPQLYANHRPRPGTAGALSPRQRQILAALGAGRTSKQIAADFGISIKTVETHRARIMEALGCRNAVELLRVAVRLHDGP